MTHRPVPLLLSVGSTVSIVALWEVLARTGVLVPTLSSPILVARWLGSAVETSQFWIAVRETSVHWAMGVLLGTAAGVVVGVAVGTSRILMRLVQVCFEFLRPVPAIVYLPLMLLLFGAAGGVAVGLAALGVFWPVFYQTLYGIEGLDRIALETGRVFGLSASERVKNIILPGIAPSVATGIRVGAGIALIVAITMELIGGIPGLGSELRTYQLNGIYSALYALILVMGLMGLLVNVGMEAAERRILHWHAPNRNE